MTSIEHLANILALAAADRTFGQRQILIGGLPNIFRFNLLRAHQP